MTHAAAPWLERKSGYSGAGGAVLYAAAKGFVSTLTRGQAKELIGEKIRVNGVAPGVIATPFHERYSDDAANGADGARGNAGGLRRRLSVPRLGGAERLRHWPDHRGQRRAADAVKPVSAMTVNVDIVGFAWCAGPPGRTDRSRLASSKTRRR